MMNCYASLSPSENQIAVSTSAGSESREDAVQYRWTGGAGRSSQNLADRRTGGIFRSSGLDDFCGSYDRYRLWASKRPRGVFDPTKEGRVAHLRVPLRRPERWRLQTPECNAGPYAQAGAK